MIKLSDLKFFCWATFVDSEKYLNEALALALSLKKVKTLYPLYIFVPDTFTANEKFKEFEEIKNKYLDNVYIIPKPALSFRDDDIGFASTANKFYCLELLSEYNKVCFLDSDVILLHNYDHVFFYEENKDTLKTNYRPPRAIDNEGICGDIMIFRQGHQYILDYVKQHCMEFNQDEAVVNKLFFETDKCHFLTKENRFDSLYYTYHDAGNPKIFSYFVSFNQIIEIFENNSLEDIENLIEEFSEVYKRMYAKRVLEAVFHT